MKELLKKSLPCILMITVLLNFTAANVYADDDAMTEEGTTSLIEEAGGGAGILGGIADGIVGVLTIFLRIIVIGIAGAVQGVLTAIASADGSSMVRMADAR